MIVLTRAVSKHAFTLVLALILQVAVAEMWKSN